MICEVTVVLKKRIARSMDQWVLRRVVGRMVTWCNLVNCSIVRVVLLVVAEVLDVLWL